MESTDDPFETETETRDGGSDSQKQAGAVSRPPVSPERPIRFETEKIEEADLGDD